MKHKYLLSTLLCVATAFAHAENNSLDEVVVTASRFPQSLSKTLADTTVLNEQEIRQSGATDVETLLRSVAGIEIMQTGGLGSQSSIFMRGTNSNQVLVLIDGVRINSATAGTTALEHIMLDSIERIEIVRGNVSSLYGSEAIGGVIQLFTKQGRGAPTFNASVGLGNQGTQRLAAGYAGSLDKYSFSVNAAHVKTEGVSAMEPLILLGANPNNNGYDNESISAQIKHALNADHVLSATVFGLRGNSSYDVNGTFQNLPTDLHIARSNIGKWSLASDKQIGERWRSQVRLAKGVDDYRSYLNGVQSARLQTQSSQVAWQNDLKVADGQRLSVSVEYLGQSVSSDTLFTQTTRNVNSVLGGYTGEYGAQQVQLNVRRDGYSDFGTANTGLLGYGVSFADSWRASASISTAFKAPTFNDLFAPLAWGSNATLKPERSQNKEVGLHYADNGHRMDALYFDNRIHDLIAYKFPMMMNINDAQIIGQELIYAGDWGNKRLKASVTLQNPRDTGTGQPLLRRAKQFAHIGTSHEFADWTFGIEARYSGARPDVYYNTNTFSNTAVTLPSYSLVNLTSRYSFDKNLNITARVDNLFNRNYSGAYGYTPLGRTLFVGLNYQQ